MFRIEIEFRCAALPCKCSPTHSDWQSGIHEAHFPFELIKGEILVRNECDIYRQLFTVFLLVFFTIFASYNFHALQACGNGQPETGSSPQKRLNCTRRCRSVLNAFVSASTQIVWSIVYLQMMPETNEPCNAMSVVPPVPLYPVPTPWQTS